MAVSVASYQGQVQQRLGLTNAPDAHNKHIVLVKLTDSSLEALTNYIKHASSARVSTKPTIHFSNNTGTFTVPIVGGEGNMKLQKFNFSLSSNQESGPQASFECLESRKPDSLESLGPVQHKAQVQASERSFEKFREQLGDVKREQEKRTTRILDKSKIGGAVAAAGLVSGKRIVSRKHILANKSLQSAGRSNDLNKYSHTHGHGSRSQSQQPTPPPLIKNGCHPMLDRNKHKKPTNPEIMKRTLRERVVHLLAVRPLKKPELMDRMTQDGVREKEKKELWSTLIKQVSILKDNAYHLRKDVWNDVSEDWPFYTEEERQAFLRRKPQNLTPPGSDGGSTESAVSGHSSSSSHPSSPQPSLKRSSAYPSNGDGSPLSDHVASQPSTSPAGKKKKVSNFMKPTSSLSPMSSLGRSPNNRSPSAPVLPPAAPEESFESKTNAWLRGSMESPERPLTRAQLKTNQDLDRISPSSKITDFTNRFVRIECIEQRKAYKAEFDKDYSRYKILHSQLDRVSQRFANLQQQLRHTPEASPDHQRLKKMIVKEYQTANDSQIKRDREEFHYLHKKLEHIKKLVHVYDTEHPKQQPPGLLK